MCVRECENLVNRVEGLEPPYRGLTTLASSLRHLRPYIVLIKHRLIVSVRFGSIDVFDSTKWKHSIIRNLLHRRLIKVHPTGFSPNPTRHTAWSSSDEDWLLGCLNMVHSAFLKTLSIRYQFL
ncbi:hypothetical protein NPIL_48941 [Nephila pilipes]|uniref:Uncharacterized protein n=1 Tax=Nephila pilipes TaxID=299642 RepID=A0A8X6NGG5_NEPPI|nr:hypothetical protein NPIL_48941 [Nephila pilipes]